MKKKYETYNHAKVHLRYHIIFSTKYRRNCLDEIKNDLVTVFYEIANISKFRILEIGVDKNHVHLFVKAPPSISVTQIVKRIKSMSTIRLCKLNEDYLSKFYWKKKVLWTHGYFCSTVGEMNESTIINYIQTQG